MLSYLSVKSQVRYQNDFGISLLPNRISNDNRDVVGEIGVFLIKPTPSFDGFHKLKLEYEIPSDPTTVSLDWFVVDGAVITNHHYRKPRLMAKYGYVRLNHTGWGEFYYGGDINLGWAYLRNKHLYAQAHPDSRNYSSFNTNLVLGLTPNTGLKIYLSKHFILTLETGVEFNYQYSYIPVFDGNTTTYTRLNTFETSWKDRWFINDISISYRF